MPRSFLLGAALALLSGCLTAVPGVGCHEATAAKDCAAGETCKVGVDGQGVCVAPASLPDGGTIVVVEGDAGLPLDLVLTLTVPSDPLKTAEAVVTAHLARQDGSPYDAPGPVRLKVVRQKPQPIEQTAAYVLPHAGTGLFAGPVSFPRDGTWQLDADLPGASLTARLLVGVDACAGACNAIQECQVGVCRKVFGFAFVWPDGGSMPTKIALSVTRRAPPDIPLVSETPLPKAIAVDVSQRLQPTATHLDLLSSDGAAWAAAWSSDRSGVLRLRTRVTVKNLSGERSWDLPEVAADIRATLTIVQPATTVTDPLFAGYRRGERNTVSVSADVVNLAAASLEVTGVPGDPSAGIVSLTASETFSCLEKVTPPAWCPCSATVRSCAAFVGFDFAGRQSTGAGPALRLPGLAGSFSARALGQDDDGVDAVQATADLAVTRARWKWAGLATGATIYTSLVVLRGGIVVFGASDKDVSPDANGPSWWLFAVGPEGDLKSSAGPFAGSIRSISALDVPGAPVIAAVVAQWSANQGGAIAQVYTTSLQAPSTTGAWAFTAPAKINLGSGEPTASLATAWMFKKDPNSGTVWPNLVLAYYSGGYGHIRRWTPTAPASGYQASGLTFSVPAAAHIGLSVTGGTANLGSEQDGSIWETSLQAPDNMPLATPEWSLPLATPTGASGYVRGIVFTPGARLGFSYAGSSQVLFEVPGLSPFPFTLTNLQTTGLAASASGRLLVASAPTSAAGNLTPSELRSLPVAGTIGAAMTAATLPTGTTAVGGPLLGATGRVYLGAAYTDSGRTTTEGRVYLTDASLASLSTPWALKSLPLTRPPALDCARPLFAGPKVAQLGTLYIVSGPTLVALSVDDWGLDANAPWPQDGHDPNWTFSADGPVKCLE